MYEHRPARSIEAHTLAISVCLKALTDFTRNINPSYLQHPADRSLLRIVENTPAFDPRPWRALREPFDMHARELRDQGMFDWPNQDPTWAIANVKSVTSYATKTDYNRAQRSQREGYQPPRSHPHLKYS